MKKISNETQYGLNQIMIGLAITTILLLSGCSSKSEIQFPVNVGVKPESITKGFNGN